MPDNETERLRAENAELRRRVELAEQQIETIRHEALQRRAEVRAMAESLPAAVSRRRLALELLRGSRRSASARPTPTGNPKT